MDADLFAKNDRGQAEIHAGIERMEGRDPGAWTEGREIAAVDLSEADIESGLFLKKCIELRHGGGVGRSFVNPAHALPITPAKGIGMLARFDHDDGLEKNGIHFAGVGRLPKAGRPSIEGCFTNVRPRARLIDSDV